MSGLDEFHSADKSFIFLNAILQRMSTRISCLCMIFMCYRITLKLINKLHIFIRYKEDSWSVEVTLSYEIFFKTDETGCSRSDQEVIKLFSCSTQPSRKFILLLNVKMPTIISRIND